MMSRFAAILFCLMLSVAVHAADVFVPEELRGWERWVLQGHEHRSCPFVFNRDTGDRGSFICAWPGVLDIDVSADDGRFSQRWTVYKDFAWVPLPGDAAYWPHDVTVNGNPAIVVEHDGVPSLRLDGGSYTVSGRFEWDERPGVLPIPAQSGLIELTVNGDRVARPERSRTGLFLGERQRETKVRDSVRAEVYRLVTDEVPTRLATMIKVDVAGGVREELFGPALPEGFVPMAIHSALPARLEADGTLRVQVRPGRWDITIMSHAPDVLNEIALTTPETNLPATEIWSYQSNERLRVTAAEGLPPVDPRQAQVPPQWQQLPAFRIEAGEALTIIERSRGVVANDNELGLNRTMWLDFDGDGFIVRDYINGIMRSDWRLDMAPPYALLSATEAGENLLITNGSEEGETGIELRQTSLAVTSIGRSETRSGMPVTGWDARFSNVGARLNLPPGHKLLAAPGAKAPASWVSQWRLLDFFLVLIMTIAAWRLFGRTAGIIALAALTLSFHELNAPAWLWLNLLIAIALMRVAPPGRLRQLVSGYQAISVILLAFALVPFIAGQLRIAIYPQLEPQYGVDAGLTSGIADYERLDRPAAAPVDDRLRQLQVEPGRETAAKVEMFEADAVEEVVVTGAKSGQNLFSTSYSRYAPNAIVQAGPGVPSWQWNSYRLYWSGPVDAEQSMRLVILPRWAVTLLRFVQVALLLLFAAVLATAILKRRWRLPGGLNIGAAQASSVIAAGTLALLLGLSPAAEAQTPDAKLLQELKARLLEAPDCVPRCAEIVAADVDVRADSVRMRLVVNALEEVALPLPGSENGWLPQAVAVDGTSAAQVIRVPGQGLWLRVTPGRHTVDVRGAALAADSLEIPFRTPPRVIEVTSDGWFVAGLKDRRLLSGSLQLTRLQSDDSEPGAPRWESSRFPAFVHIERSIQLDIDWRVTTTVIRQAPMQGALTLEVPLIEGETVMTEDVAASDGKVLVSMNPNQARMTWTSTLPRKTPMTLSASAGAPWKEIWRVGVGSIWHAQFSGVPESETQGFAGGARVAEFHPRGGESLTMVTTRPDASEGTTLAFDAVGLSVSQGETSSTSRLTLRYRSTRGAQHVLRLPESVEVTEVRIDDRIEPLRADGTELTVPILPGEHSISVSWRDSADAGSITKTPEVDLGAPSGNINMNVTLPQNRWLLGTSGPRLGPAVLYWPELAALILFAFILGRIDLTPLNTWQWLLLGLGFSTFNWPVLGVVVLWLLASGAKDRWRSRIPWLRYNTMQVLFAGFTVFALLSIVVSLPAGLLGSPDMHVTGNGSYGNTLAWFADRADAGLPIATAWSVPIWIYKVLILGWALWLSFALLRWLPWVWQCFARDGFWHSRKGDTIESSAAAE